MRTNVFKTALKQYNNTNTICELNGEADQKHFVTKSKIKRKRSDRSEIWHGGCFFFV